MDENVSGVCAVVHRLLGATYGSNSRSDPVGPKRFSIELFKSYRTVCLKLRFSEKWKRCLAENLNERVIRHRSGDAADQVDSAHRCVAQVPL